MEKINLKGNQANKFIKTGFEVLGYPKISNIEIYILPNKNVSYYVYYESFYHNNVIKVLKVLDLNSIIKVIRIGMNELGYENVYIKPIIKNKNISYIVNANIVSYDNKLKKVKRR